MNTAIAKNLTEFNHRFLLWHPTAGQEVSAFGTHDIEETLASLRTSNAPIEQQHSLAADLLVKAAVHDVQRNDSTWNTYQQAVEAVAQQMQVSPGSIERSALIKYRLFAEHNVPLESYVLSSIRKGLYYRRLLICKRIDQFDLQEAGVASVEACAQWFLQTLRERFASILYERHGYGPGQEYVLLDITAGAQGDQIYLEIPDRDLAIVQGEMQRLGQTNTVTDFTPEDEETEARYVSENFYLRDQELRLLNGSKIGVGIRTKEDGIHAVFERYPSGKKGACIRQGGFSLPVYWQEILEREASSYTQGVKSFKG